MKVEFEHTRDEMTRSFFASSVDGSLFMSNIFGNEAANGERYFNSFTTY